MSSITKLPVLPWLMLIAWTVRAQTGGDTVRFVDGVAYYPQKDPRWQNRVGECDKILPDGLVVHEIVESQSIGVYVSPVLSGPRGGRAYGSSFFLKNYSDKTPPQTGQQVRCFAIHTATKTIDGQKMEVWDCGTSDSSSSVTNGVEHFRHGAPPESWKPRVNAELSLAGAVIRVKNRGKEDWPPLLVKLETANGSEFIAQTPALSAGGTVELPLTIFSNTAGESPNQTNLFKKVSIGGNGFQFGAYRL